MTLNRRSEQDPNQTHLGVNQPHRFVGWGRIPGAEPGPALALPQPPTPGGTGALGQVRAHHFKTKPGTASAGAFWGDEASSSGAVPPPRSPLRLYSPLSHPAHKGAGAAPCLLIRDDNGTPGAAPVGTGCK